MNIKKEILNALESHDFARVNACFLENEAMTSRILQMYVYGLPNDLKRWRAIEYLGQLAGCYCDKSDDLFRNIIRRFIWQMCEESANVPWASAEVIGSILSRVEGKRFKEFIGPWFYHTDLNDICYAGLYWSLPSMMQYHSAEVEKYLPATFKWFESYDMPDLRGYAAIYFKSYPKLGMKDALKNWLDDARLVHLFVDEKLQEYQVANLARSALDAIEA